MSDSTLTLERVARALLHVRFSTYDERIDEWRAANNSTWKGAMRDARAALDASGNDELVEALTWIAGHDAAANGLTGFAAELVDSFTTAASAALAKVRRDPAFAASPSSPCGSRPDPEMMVRPPCERPGQFWCDHHKQWFDTDSGWGD